MEVPFSEVEEIRGVWGGVDLRGGGDRNHECGVDILTLPNK